MTENNPPIPAIKELSTLFPSKKIEPRYSGKMLRRGRVVFCNGEQTY